MRKSTHSPRRLRPAFLAVAKATDYTPAVLSIYSLSIELLKLGQAPQNIAEDLYTLRRGKVPDLGFLVGEIVLTARRAGSAA